MSFVEDLRTIQEEVYNVLDLTNVDTKDIYMNAETTCSFGIDSLTEILSKENCTPDEKSEIIVSKFQHINTNIQKGATQMEQTCSKINNVLTSIKSLKRKLNDRRRKESENIQSPVVETNDDLRYDTESDKRNYKTSFSEKTEEPSVVGEEPQMHPKNTVTHKTSEKLVSFLDAVTGILVKWKIYKHFFTSICMSIDKGLDVVANLTKLSSNEMTAVLISTSELRRLSTYVRSIRTSTYAFVTIYNEQLKDLVGDFRTNKANVPTSLENDIENRYYALLKKTGEIPYGMQRSTQPQT